MDTKLLLEAINDVAAGKRRIDALAIFNRLAQKVPRLANDPERWEQFVALLESAEKQQLLCLPARAGDGWINTVVPARPKWVNLPTVKTQREVFDHRGHPWNPRIAFVAETAYLPPTLRDVALSLQGFFSKGGEDRPFVPIKERSFDIFGDEKRLEELLNSSLLFGDGRLNLDLLRCYIVSPTPVAERFVSGKGIFVAENEATFDSFCRIARNRDTWRLVVYGRGNEIQKCTAYLRRQMEHCDGPIDYFGDVDRQGFAIPMYLLNAGIPVRPFLIGYEALLGSKVAGNTKEGEWLPAPLDRIAADLFAAGRRIPQEAFGWEELAGIYGLNPLTHG